MIESMDFFLLDGTRLCGYIDHTLLRADATAGQIETLCAEARENHFGGVCVNGSWLRHARRLLEGTMVRIVAAVGFPLGAMSCGAKCYEAEAAVGEGASEIDFVLNIGRLKQGDDRYVLEEIRDVVKAAAGRPVRSFWKPAC